MCLVIFAHRLLPDYPLVVAANRDEFHVRPTAVASFWAEHPHLLAGRDLEQGGTWMGVTRQGRFAAITNYRDPARTAAAPRSRGELPLAYLTGTLDPEGCLLELARCANEYAGFNLLLGDHDQLWYFTNSLPGHQRVPLCLAPGIYGLSNARLDTPWPKVQLGKSRLQQMLNSGAPPRHDTLLDVVQDKSLADPAALRIHGLDSGMDHLLSAQFIINPQYGTRSTTTLWTDNSGRANWRELSLNEQGEVTGQSEIAFDFIG